MAEVHPTTIIEGDVQLADDVVIGPHCVLTGPITIGSGCRLIGNVYLHGPLTLGARNTIYPFASLGYAPQHAKFDPATPGHGLVIGDDNTFREQFTAHRAFTDDGPTRIGNGNLFMVASHIGHDCNIGNDCTLVNGALIGGHATIHDHVTIGGCGMVHQFVRVGEGVMISGGAGPTQDVPPYFMVTSINVCGSINIVGLRRRGIPRDQIDDVRWVYRMLYRSRLPLVGAVSTLRERGDRPMVRKCLDFIADSRRGICPGPAKLTTRQARPRTNVGHSETYDGR